MTFNDLRGHTLLNDAWFKYNLNYLDESLISENGCVSVEDYLADATEFIHDRQFDNQVTFNHLFIFKAKEIL